MRHTKNKYGAKKVKLEDGTVFDSKLEYQRWVELCSLQAAGIIQHLQRQVPYVLYPSGPKGSGIQKVRYIADFVYTQDGRHVVEDVKGMITATYRLKKAMMWHVHGILVQEWRG